MICRIYKIYYRKEYNQLKRFKTLSYDELVAFETDEELFATIAARILTVAPFMGIDVDPECILVKDDVEEILDDETYGYKTDPDFFHFKDGVFEQASGEARELLERLKKENPNFFFDNDVQKFFWKVFKYHGVPTDFDLICEPYFVRDEREYAVTIALLKSLWPKRTFSDRELMFFRALYRILNIFIDHLGFFDEKVDLMIGREDKFEFELELSRYDPKKQKVARAVAGGSGKTKLTSAGKTDNTSADDGTHELYSQIEHLQAELRAKNQTIEQLNRMYREASEKEKQNRIDTDSWEGDCQELKRLREQVYHMTREDLPDQSISPEEMEEAIRGRRIVIVGGHDNWTGFLKEKFPDWTYIKPGVTNTVHENAVMHADYLFFFTDTISHGAYNKFLKVVRTHEIPFGYLHGTNIPETVRQVFETMKEKP